MTTGARSPVVRIEKLVAGGDGLARHEGRVLFVPGTAPGERHRVEIVQQKKDYGRARSLSCVEPSPDRREPPCPFHSTCGGCALMHLAPEAQRRTKRAILEDCLARIASSVVREAGLPPVRVVASPETGYRSRARFHVREAAGRVRVGFHPRRASQVVDVDACLLASGRVGEVYARVRDALVESPAVGRAVATVELQESGDGSGRVTGRFVVRSGHGWRRFDEKTRKRWLRRTGLDGLTIARAGRPEESSAGDDVARHRLRGHEYQQSSASFFQVNRFLLEPLVDGVLPEREVSRSIDLYCGVGLFSLPLAECSSEVIGVESSRSSYEDAVRNQKHAGLEGLRFVHEDAARFAAEFPFEASDYVVVDPPRGGLPEALRRSLARSPVGTLRYVSCDPPALARDLSALCAEGFRITGLTLFDFFPNTHHFETVASLERTPLD